MDYGMEVGRQAQKNIRVPCPNWCDQNMNMFLQAWLVATIS